MSPVDQDTKDFFGQQEENILGKLELVDTKLTKEVTNICNKFKYVDEKIEVVFDKLDKHEGRIQSLEVTRAVTEEKLNNIENKLDDIKRDQVQNRNDYLSGNNLILQSLQNFTTFFEKINKSNNYTEIQLNKSKYNIKKLLTKENIIIALIGLGGTIIALYFK